jgi:RNA polymerase-binding transcription factor DksA
MLHHSIGSLSGVSLKTTKEEHEDKEDDSGDASGDDRDDDREEEQEQEVRINDKMIKKSYINISSSYLKGEIKSYVICI